ncbi:hypothetical protein M5W83_03605 [Paenibacillus thiaminolyticus]|uniref:Uncharacterized protein n=1 Tax=Paenibacillus thiaminolyticus TaxID=49283 RepID=A0AAP9E086_PANTH|nr:hypothetical protein [Paenibacillus thiaminolyticus]MCY9535332.1 hypothetical protein [Paenibacillus thiaminolyticus]MCY9602593.1 hypothetical protein [Paenibacillus thiaminolyticus]MCY9606245.1 hypothetical protein [Paenibacillus thiaminolyticus]MCY9612637.1 hypothetical protein [Paenibacillus thiaminolyticus]MCY9621475.1 hypothetical protein [Paenibacillus thiaminolyticus]
MKDLKILKERKECIFFKRVKMIAVMDGSEGMHRLPFDDNERISIFAPKHFEDRLSKDRYPDCSILTMKHLKQKRVNLMPLPIMI